MRVQWMHTTRGIVPTLTLMRAAIVTRCVGAYAWGAPLLTPFAQSPEVDEVVVRNHALPGPRLAALPGYSTESSASGSNILSNQKTPALCKSPLVWEGAEREFDGCSEASSDGTSDGDNTDGLPRNAPNSGPESSPSSEEVDEDVLSDESSDRENGDKTFSDGLQGYEEESEDDEKVKVDDSAEGKPVLAAGAIWVAFSFLAMTLL